jgi:hypothetical protein
VKRTRRTSTSNKGVREEDKKDRQEKCKDTVEDRKDRQEE